MLNFFKSYYNFSNNIYLKLAYLVCSFTFVTLLIFIPITNTLTSICIIWSLILVPITVLKALKYKSYKYIFQILVYIFLGYTLLLTFTQYPNIENIKIFAINSIILNVFFSIDEFKKIEDLYIELNLFSYFFVIISFILSTISLILILFNKTIHSLTAISPDSNEIIHAYTGLFHNGNAFGIAAGISILFSIYLFLSTKKKHLKYMLTFNCFIQFIAMIKSDGRSSYIFLIVLPFTFLFIKLKKFWPRLILILTTSIFILVILNLSSDNIHAIFTGRQNIWRAAFILISTYPIFGVGNFNLVPMIDSVRDTWLYGVELGGLHNIYIEVFTVNGVVSGIIFLLIIFFIFIRIIQKIDLLSDVDLLKYIILFSLVVGIALINVFESNLIYSINFIAIVFWSVCGYLIAILNKK